MERLMAGSTSDKRDYAHAMEAARAAGWVVNATDYGSVVVEIIGSGAVSSLPGWEHENQSLLDWASADEARRYIAAYWLAQVTGGDQLSRFERRYLADRGFDRQGRRIAA